MYPLKYHMDNNLDKIYQVIETFPFATLISRTEDDVLVSQLPLILNRNRGNKGVLVGHIDNNNPQVKYLNRQNVSIIFHGPDTYISPRVYESAQLPTWNNISVHAKGQATTLKSSDEVANTLIKMAEFLEPKENTYVLRKDDKKFSAMVNYITGFEIELTELIGRFKLSQDKSSRDTELAKQQLIHQSKADYTNLIHSLLEK